MRMLLALILILCSLNAVGLEVGRCYSQQTALKAIASANQIILGPPGRSLPKSLPGTFVSKSRTSTNGFSWSRRAKKFCVVAALERLQTLELSQRSDVDICSNPKVRAAKTACDRLSRSGLRRLPFSVIGVSEKSSLARKVTSPIQVQYGYCRARGSGNPYICSVAETSIK